jgi:hypothetical protein
MINTKELATQIEIALTEVSGDSKGILSIGRRMKINAAMIDDRNAERSYRIRISLQEECVRHVQHLWATAFPDNSSLDDMLILARQVVQRQAWPDQAEMEAHRFSRVLTGLP